MRKYLNTLYVAIVAGLGLVSCQEDAVNLGNSVIGDSALGNIKTLGVVAYNAKFDTLRTDQFVLQNAALGIYKDNIFGSTSSKFYTQLRPNSTSLSITDFGTETSVDSVNLYIPVYSNTNPIKTDTIIIGKSLSSGNDTILIKKTYTVDSIYGNKDAKMNLNIRDLNTVLLNSSKYFSKLDGSESLISTNSNILGSCIIGNIAVSKVIKVRNATTNIYEEPIGYKISMDKAYFKEKIIDNSKKGLLSDYATFIRENIKGFEFSVSDTDGFIINFNPNDIALRMYFSYKNTAIKADGDENYKQRISSNYSFNFSNIWGSATSGSRSNVVVSQVVNNHSGSTYQTILNNSNPISGDSRLFLNGMSGSYLNLKIDQDQLNELKTEMAKKNITITGAKLKFYIDDSYNFPKPPYITAWNNYVENGSSVSKLYDDVTEFYNAYPTSVHFNPIVKGSTDFYTIDITKHLKSMLEKGNEFKDQSMIITMGNFLMSYSDATKINSSNPYQNNRAYNPYRIVLHGNNSEVEAKQLKLLIYYSQR